MRKEVKELLANKIYEFTGITPLFNVHKIPRQLTKEVMFVRLDSVSRQPDDAIDEYTFEIYYAYKIVQNNGDVQEKMFEKSEQLHQLNGYVDFIIDSEGKTQQIVFWITDENYTEDYSENVGTVLEAKYTVVAYVGN